MFDPKCRRCAGGTASSGHRPGRVAVGHPGHRSTTGHLVGDHRRRPPTGRHREPADHRTATRSHPRRTRRRPDQHPGPRHPHHHTRSQPPHPRRRRHRHPHRDHRRTTTATVPGHRGRRGRGHAGPHPRPRDPPLLPQAARQHPCRRTRPRRAIPRRHRHPAATRRTARSRRPTAGLHGPRGRLHRDRPSPPPGLHLEPPGLRRHEQGRPVGHPRAARRTRRHAGRLGRPRQMQPQRRKPLRRRRTRPSGRRTRYPLPGPAPPRRTLGGGARDAGLRTTRHPQRASGDGHRHRHPAGTAGRHRQGPHRRRHPAAHGRRHPDGHPRQPLPARSSTA